MRYIIKPSYFLLRAPLIFYIGVQTTFVFAIILKYLFEALGKRHGGKREKNPLEKNKYK